MRKHFLNKIINTDHFQSSMIVIGKVFHFFKMKHVYSLVGGQHIKNRTSSNEFHFHKKWIKERLSIPKKRVFIKHIYLVILFNASIRKPGNFLSSINYI